MVIAPTGYRGLFYTFIFLVLSTFLLRLYQWYSDINMIYQVEVFKRLSRDRNRHSHFVNTSRLASEWLGNDQKVYISLSTISERLYGIVDTINSIVNGTVVPDHIYVLISREGYLLDKGIQSVSLMSQLPGFDNLISHFPNISIIYTENIGSHRKLLPLLTQKWQEDCVIVTVDDHDIYSAYMLESLLTFYQLSGGDSIVALRARRIGICGRTTTRETRAMREAWRLILNQTARGRNTENSSSSFSTHVSWRIAPYTNIIQVGQWPEMTERKIEMLLLPTGMNGVLYRPRFFHPIVFDRKLRSLTSTGDDIMFRLTTMAKGVYVAAACLINEPHCSAVLSRSNIENMMRPTTPSTPTPTSPLLVSGGNHVRDTTEHKLQFIESEIKGIVHPSGANPKDVIVDGRGEKKVRPRRRKLRHSKRSDPRKIVSLASKYNTAGGNNKMWHDAVAFLKSNGILDLDSILRSSVLMERISCVFNTTSLTVTGKDVGTNSYRKEELQRTRQQDLPNVADRVWDVLHSAFADPSATEPTLFYKASCGFVDTC